MSQRHIWILTGNGQSHDEATAVCTCIVFKLFTPFSEHWITVYNKNSQIIIQRSDCCNLIIKILLKKKRSRNKNMGVWQCDKNASQLVRCPKHWAVSLGLQWCSSLKTLWFFSASVCTCAKEKMEKTSTWRNTSFSAVHKTSEARGEKVWSKCCVFVEKK